MSCDGEMIGAPFAGLKMLFVDIISVVRFDLRLDRQRQVDGHLVAVEVGVEALADQRVERIALPSTSTGSNAWMPMRCSVGARFSSTG
jgi:hypothetical protein